MSRFFLSLTLLLTSCAAQQIHPGAVNQFDSTTYDALLITHSVIETTKTDLASGVFSATLSPKVKTAVNELITAYDAADKLYINYHNAAIAGTSTTVQMTNVSNAIQSVNNATTALTNAKAWK